MDITLDKFLKGLMDFFKQEIITAPGPVSRARAKAIAAALEEYREDIIALGDSNHKVNLASYFGKFTVKERKLKS